MPGCIDTTKSALPARQSLLYQPKMPPNSLDQLTENQKACLRLLWQERMTIAQVGYRLGIAEDTVDQRLRGARRRLGVTSSMDAARLLAEHENVSGLPDMSPSSVYPSSDIPSEPVAAPPPGHRSNTGASWHWPLPRWNGEENDLGVGQRVFWSFTLAALAIITMVMAMSMGEAVTRLSLMLR